MLLNLLTFFIVPVYTILFTRHFNLFTLNFSVIGNFLGRQNAFVLWGILTGLCYYLLLSRIGKNLKLSRAKKSLIYIGLVLLLFSITTPYLPEQFPFKSFLHIVFAMMASLILVLYIFAAALALRRTNRPAGIFSLWTLGAVLLISFFLLVLAGIISSALEIFFSLTTLFLSRFILWQSTCRS